MLLLLGVALALQVQVGGGRRDRATVVKDSTPDSVLAQRRDAQRRLPVTREVLATAFRDPTARTLLTRARVARLVQDSSLIAYDASAYQRISAGMGFSRIGRDRLIFRNENAWRIRWQRDVGAWVELRGARTALPGMPGDAQEEVRIETASEAEGAPIPYFPGYEPLWIGGDVARAQVNERELVHPIAEGAEAYYLYETGDSLSFRLPDGKVVQLRELKVRPRLPKWNVAVGSLWFDTNSGQLVRAAYRLAEPLAVWTMVREEDPKATDDIPRWVMPLISPIKAQISAIAVEYGLYEGRFWLPRIQAAEGGAQVSFMRVPFKFEQSFKYASVNGRDTLPPIVVAERPGEAINDSLPEQVRDSIREARRDSTRAARRAQRDSVRAGLRPAVHAVAECDTSEYRLRTRYRFEDVHMPVAYKVPCNLDKLAESPELPKSIFDEGEELFGAKEREALIAEALSMGAQPPLTLRLAMLPKPTLRWGMEYMRYNRVEGFSAGALAEQVLGGGYSAHALGRIGTGDWEPNLDLSFERTNLVKTLHVGAYNHLVAANDWGSPLSFGSSLSSLLFGRDEGFYYKATGVELGLSREPRSLGANFDGRLFVERQRTAKQNTDFSLGPSFIPNIESQAGTWLGGSMRLNQTRGLDPRGFRLLTDFRVEGAAVANRDTATLRSDAYGRAALDLTASHGLGGQVVGALTLSGGSSAGSIPTQRRWFLGGAQTVRGERPDTALSGNAYWLTRAELGLEGYGVRPVVFGDVGWVGNRSRVTDREFGRPMSGVGTGASFMDGLIRFDVARGLYPQKRWQVSAYLEARF